VRQSGVRGVTGVLWTWCFPFWPRKNKGKTLTKQRLKQMKSVEIGKTLKIVK